MVWVYERGFLAQVSVIMVVTEPQPVSTLSLPLKCESIILTSSDRYSKLLEFSSRSACTTSYSFNSWVCDSFNFKDFNLSGEINSGRWDPKLAKMVIQEVPAMPPPITTCSKCIRSWKLRSLEINMFGIIPKLRDPPGVVFGGDGFLGAVGEVLGPFGAFEGCWYFLGFSGPLGDFWGFLGIFKKN